MTIGIEAQRIFRKKKHGMDIFVLELIRHLQQLDTVNQYYVFVRPGPDRCLQETANFHLVELPAFSYLDWEQIALPRYSKRLGLDLMHCTSNTAPFFQGCPTLLTVHDVIYLSDPAAKGGSFYQQLGHYYRRWVVPQVARKAAGIVTVSGYEKKIISKFLDNNAISHIYNGVSNQFYLPNREQRFADLPEEYIFFLGNLAHKKNMPNMLRAYGQYASTSKNCLPLVIGETSPLELEQALAKLELPHLRSRIKLLGYVPHQLLPEVYRRASLFVYPSLRESFGIPILEAMASGTPVITSTYASMPEVAGGAAMLVQSRDYRKLAVAISDVLDNESLRKDMIVQGFERAMEFSWGKVAAQYLAKYEETVSGGVKEAA